MQLILVFETRASCQSDYIYVKSAIDFFYVERKHKITPIYAKAKSELTNCGKKINERPHSIYNHAIFSIIDRRIISSN